MDLETNRKSCILLTLYLDMTSGR